MARVSRKFILARLQTATSIMVSAGVIPPFARFGLEQTGSDKYPWQVVMDEIGLDNGRSRTRITDAVSWQGACVAVDALYNTAFVAQQMCEIRQG